MGRRLERLRVRGRRVIHRPPVGRWRAWLPFAGVLLLLLLAPAFAYAQGAGQDSVKLEWTAPGDDGTVGTASTYDIRMSLALITDANFAQATQVPGLPAPQVAGTRQSVVIHGLTNGTTYYFALRTVDDVGNWSPTSNVLRWDWVLDTSPPAAPSGVSAARQGSNVQVSWAANTEPDLSGYSVYRSTTQTGTYSRLNNGIISVTDFVDSALPNGASEVWYEVTASDINGNESARSAAKRVSLSTTRTSAATSWTIDPGYPNPSKSTDPVRIPVVIPANGAGSAVIDIVDSGGHLVRRLSLAGLGAGANQVVWDGKNDSGRITAPGVYRAWLNAGGGEHVIRLVRLP